MKKQSGYLSPDHTLLILLVLSVFVLWKTSETVGWFILNVNFGG